MNNTHTKTQKRTNNGSATLRNITKLFSYDEIFRCHIFIELFLLNCYFLVMRTDAITKWRNTKGWIDIEQYPHHNGKANQQWFRHTKKYP